MASGITEAIRAGDVLRDRWSAVDSPRVNLYLGSGRCGACFDAWGLMHHAPGETRAAGIGNTVLTHADHARRDARGVEEWLPLAQLVWADDQPSPPTAYRQHLDLFDGRLTTELGWPDLSIVMKAQFHPERRDVFGIEVQYDATGNAPMPALLLAPTTHVRTDGDAIEGRFEARTSTTDGMHWAAVVNVGTAETLLGMCVLRHDGQADVRSTSAGARIEFTGPRGRHTMLVGAGAPSRGGTIADDLTTWNAQHPFADSATAAWHKRWGEPEVSAGDRDRQMLRVRSAFYLLCSYAPDSHAPGPPHGWSGNGPLIHDPRAAADVVAALLGLGYGDLAKGIVEFYRSRGAAGRLQDFDTAALVARMARDVSLHLRDAAWSREVAWPLIHDGARLCASELKEDPGGTWTMADAARIPAARDCLQAAVSMAGELGVSGSEFANYRGILSDGFTSAATPDELGATAPDFASDDERIQFFAPGDHRTPFHLPTHARFLRPSSVTLPPALR